MNLCWHDDARSEADAAALFYQDKQPGLAVRFLDSLDETLHRIQRHPDLCRRVEGAAFPLWRDIPSPFWVY